MVEATLSPLLVILYCKLVELYELCYSPTRYDPQDNLKRKRSQGQTLRLSDVEGSKNRKGSERRLRGKLQG